MFGQDVDRIVKVVRCGGRSVEELMQCGCFACTEALKRLDEVEEDAG